MNTIGIIDTPAAIHHSDAGRNAAPAWHHAQAPASGESVNRHRPIAGRELRISTRCAQSPRRPAILAALFALALTCLAPATAVAQQATINLGTHSGINFNLIRPVTNTNGTTDTTDDKLYYHLDANGLGSADRDDRVMHSMLDTLLNDGSGTTDTQPGNHDGSDDVRSVIINGYALILPTTAEMRALSVNRGGEPYVPTGWRGGSEDYWTSTPAATAGQFNVYRFSEDNFIGRRSNLRFVTAFQVIDIPASVPAAPTGVTATHGNGESVVTWVTVPPADNGGSPITGYTASATASTQPTRTCTAGAAATNCTIENLANGTLYNIAVVATNGVGSSASSGGEVRAAPGIPAIPLGLTLTPINEGIMARWELVPTANQGGSAVLDYNVRVFPAAGGGQVGSCTTPDAATDNCDITGLTNGVEYRAVVRARNAHGNSVSSPRALATPEPSPLPTLTPIDDQTYIIGETASFILPAADGGTSPYTYTLTPTADIPAGLAFTAADRTLAGIPTAADSATLVYTVTDDAATPGSAAQTFTVTTRDRPSVESVTAADPSGIHMAGDVVILRITFSEAVTVDTTGGTPQLALDTGNSDDGMAGFSGISTGGLAAFEYTVLAGDNTADLAYTGTNALDLNGGSIRSTAGALDIAPALPEPGASNSLSDSSDSTAVVLDTTAPAFTHASTSAGRLQRSVAFAATTTFIIHDAAATDRGRAEDIGITYALTGSALFGIDMASGAITPAATIDMENTYSLDITATDDAGNAATQYLTVIVTTGNLPRVDITDNIRGVANGDIIFTFAWSVAVSDTDFTDDDIIVTNGSFGGLTNIADAGLTYTLVVTPDSDTNDGTITVEVSANVVTVSGLGNLAVTATQAFDTKAPTFAEAAAAADFPVNEPVTTAVYTAAATDGVDALTYRLSEATTLTGGVANDHALFSIDSNTGIVSYRASPTTVGATHTIEIIATDKGGNTAAQILTVTVVTLPDVTLTGVPAGAALTFEYGAGASTYTLTATPAGAVLTAASAAGVVTADLAQLDLAAGTWMLTITPPSTGNDFSDTVTITATADGHTTLTQELVLTVTPLGTPTFTGFGSSGLAAFSFGDEVREINFNILTDGTVGEPTVTILPAPGTSPAFPTWNLAFRPPSVITGDDDTRVSNYQLTIRPPAADSEAGGPYSQTLTLMVTAEGHTVFTETATFRIRQPIALTGLPSAAQTSLVYGGAATDFALVADPVNAELTVSSADDVFAATVMAHPNGMDGHWVLRVTPPDTGFVYTDTLTVTARDALGERGTVEHALDFSVPPLSVALTASAEGGGALDTAPHNFGESRALVITAMPADAAVVLSTPDALFRVTENGATGGTYSFTVFAPPNVADIPPGMVASGGAYTDTLVFTGTAANHVDTALTLTYTLRQEVGLTFPDVMDTSFDMFGADALTVNFDVAPANAVVEITSANGVFTTEKTDDDRASRAFTVAPPDTDAGGMFSDDITITATDPSGLRQPTSRTFTFTIGDRIVLSDLPADGHADLLLNYGEVATYTLTSDPATTADPSSVTVTATTDMPLTDGAAVELANNSDGTWTLTVTAPATAPADGAGSALPITLSATATGRAPYHRALLVTIRPVIVLGGLPTTTSDLELDYGGAPTTFSLTLNPPSAHRATTLSAASTGGVITADITNHDNGTATLTVTPPSTGTETTDTITIAGVANRAVRGVLQEHLSFTQDVVFTTTTPRVIVSGAPDSVQLFIGDQPAVFTITSSLPTANLTVSDSSSRVAPSIARTTGGADGEWTLTIPSITFGFPFDYTVTIAARDPNGDYQDGSAFIEVTISALPAVQFVGLDLVDNPPFNFGDGARAIPFTVEPPGASGLSVTYCAVKGLVCIAPSVFTVGPLSPDPNTGARTLTVTPPANDEGMYSETIRLNAFANNRPTNQAELTFTIISALDLSGLSVITGGTPLTLTQADGSTTGFAATNLTYTATAPRSVTREVTVAAPVVVSNSTVDITGTAADGTALTAPDGTALTAGPTATVSGLTTGDNTIRVTVTANGGNTRVYTITLTVPAAAAPTIDIPIAGDNTIDHIERAAGVTLEGTFAADIATVTVCFGGTDAACTGGTPRSITVTGGTWSYPLVDADYTAMGQGGDTLYITATDTAGNTSAATTHPITVDTVVPVFAAAAIDDQFYTVGVDIPRLTLPAATEGTGALSYTLVPAASLPSGLAFDAATRVLSGIPEAAAVAALTYTATDANARTATLDLNITVVAALSLDTSLIPALESNYQYLIHRRIDTVLLPPAAGGVVPRSYALDGTLPDGLEYNSNARTISGTPTAAGDGEALTYTVTDSASPPNSLAMTFTMDVRGASITWSGGNFVETDANDGTIDGGDVVATLVGDTFTADVCTGTNYSPGNPPNAYPSSGVTIDCTRTSDTVVTFTYSGTAPNHADADDLVGEPPYNASDPGIVFIIAPFATLTPAEVANASYYGVSFDFNDPAPLTFASAIQVPVFQTHTTVNFTLPDPTDGKTPFTYALRPATLPTGLIFNTATGTITGTPIIATHSLAGVPLIDNPIDTYLYTVTDSNPPGATATATISIRTRPGSLPTNTEATGSLSILAFSIQPGQTVGLIDSFRNNISDANGIPTDAIFSFQWQAGPVGVDCDSESVFTNIPGATDRTFLIRPAQVDRCLRVQVSFTDSFGFGETVISGFTARVQAGDPNTAATGAPTVTGTPQAGMALTASPTGITDANSIPTAPNAYNYQWQQGPTTGANSNYADIPGATTDTLSLTESHVDRLIRVVVSFVDQDGYDETRTSAPTAVPVAAAAASNTPETSAPRILGARSVGSLLSADRSTITDANGIPTGNDAFTYQWQQGPAGGGNDPYTAITGATESSLLLTAAQEGRRIRVMVSFTDNDGYSEQRTSEATDAIGAAVPPGFLFTPAAVTLTEGGAATYEVALASQVFNEVVVAVQSTTSLVTATPQFLTFTQANWGIAQSVTVNAGHDANAATDTATLTHTSGYASASLSVTVTDDDAGLTLSPSPLSVTEGVAATYRVSLFAAPSDTVTVTIAGDNPAVTPTPDSLTFTTGNWDTAQAVTVNAAEDADSAGYIAILKHTASGTDFNAVVNLTVAVADDDVAELTLMDVAVNENAGTATISVGLNLEVTGGFSVDVSTVDETATAAAAADYTALTSHTLVFAGSAGETQTVALSITNDDIGENTETLRVTLGNLRRAGVNITLPSAATVTITDDDVDTLRFVTDAIDLPAAGYTYIVGTTIPTLTLPPATGGIAPLTYSLMPAADIPDGLAFDPLARTLTGMPTADGTANLVYTVTDAATTAVTLMQPFTVTVNPVVNFGTATIVAPTFVVGESMTLTLPTAAGGIPPLTYTLSSPLPTGFAYTPGSGATGGVLTGAPTAAFTATALTYLATDSAASPGSAALTFTVAALARPTVESVRGGDDDRASIGFREGGEIAIHVTFSEQMAITGTPQLLLNTGNSAGAGTADFRTFLITDTPIVAVFHYTVRAGDNTAALAYTGINALVLSGGSTIRNMAGTLDAILTLPEPGSANSLSRDGDAVKLDATDPVFTRSSSADGRARINVALDTAAGVVIHDAMASDNSRAPDMGLTYTLTGTDAGTFSLSDTGELSPKATLDAAATYSVDITAADEVGNEAMQYLTVVVADLPTVKITSDVTDDANIADGDVVFTFGWSEEVDGFDAEDISVTGGTAVTTGTGALTATVARLTYTLSVTPNASTNDGTITVTVRADAVTAAASDRNTLANTVTEATQGYDTQAPGAPTFDDAAHNNFINFVGHRDGVTVTGGVDSETITVILCRGTLAATATTCADTMFDATVTGTTWSSDLTNTDIVAFGEGQETLTAIAADAAGNTTVSAGHVITVDTDFPNNPTIVFVGALVDRVINAAERRAGVALVGTTESGTTLFVCFNGTNFSCANGRLVEAMVTDMTWTYTLDDDDFTALGQGVSHRNLRIFAYDLAGNSVGSSANITVDTVVPNDPTFDDVTGADNTINLAERTNMVDVTGRVPATTADTTVTLCAGGSDDACTGGESREVPILTYTSGGDIFWEHRLLSADYAALGQGDTTLRATAMDAAGNLSMVVSHPITVDTIPPVFPGTATAADSRATISVPTNTGTATTIFNAEATDNGGGAEVADAGLTYALDATAAATFDIEMANGVLTPKATLATVATYNVDITATDEAGNPNTHYLTITVVDRPGVNITNDAAGTVANIADGDITFTFEFTESVTGFGDETSDITVGGGTPSGTVTGSGDTYMLDVTPTANTNNGVLTITVAEGAATATVGTNRVSRAATALQEYDTQAPSAPQQISTVNNNIINAAARDAAARDAADTTRVPVQIFGGGADIDSVILCAGANPADSATCASGTPFDVTEQNGTIRRYRLDAREINALGEGEVTLTAIVADEFGNTAVSQVFTITVDTVAPTAQTIDTVSDDDFINATERDTGVTVTGTITSDTTGISLCAGATSAIDATCGGGRSITATIDTMTTTIWRSDLNTANINAIGEGEVVLTAIATDMAGNAGASTMTRRVTVDTVAPAFPSDNIGRVGVGSDITVIAFDAEATDNGGMADAGIAYGISGGNAGLFSIDSDSGEVTYRAPTTGTATHTFTITATDTAGNTATQDVTISVVNAPSLEITDSAPSEYANGAVTFTLTWDEDVTGFDSGDVSTVLSGGLTLAGGLNFTEVTPGRVYTMVVTPTAGSTNDGTFTFSVPAGRATGPTGVANLFSEGAQKFDTVTPVFTAGSTDTADFAPSDPIDTPAYTAVATDDDGTAGLTYSLSGGINVALFAIAPDSGVVTYRDPPTAATGTTHTFTVIATDKGGNTASIGVTVTLTDSDDATLSMLTLAAGGADIALEPTFDAAMTAYTATAPSSSTREVALGVAAAHSAATVAVAGSAADGSTPLTFTAAAATTTVSGLTVGMNTVTVTVSAEDGSMRAYGITLTVPAVDAPTIDTPIAVDGLISATERATGVTVTGTMESGTHSVTLCLNPSSTTAPTCGSGMGFMTDTATTTWSYTLTTTNLPTLDEGVATLTAIASDGAGNMAVSDASTVTVDTVAPAVPTFDDPVAVDNRFNAMEVAAGLTLTGEVESGATVGICRNLGCALGTVATTAASTTTWSLVLPANFFMAIDDGVSTFTATATDLAGNTSAPATHEITVDTVEPVFTPATATAPTPTTTTNREQVTVATGITTTIYDAMATDNGGVAEVADIGITYAIDAVANVTFSIDMDSGELTPTATLSTAATYNVDITATDEAGNAATHYLTITVSARPTVRITNDAAGAIANLADGALTFTFAWREAVDGFGDEPGDITVTGGTFTGSTAAASLVEVTDGLTYTLTVTPTTNTNNGVLTITVAEGAATATTGADRTNPAATASQVYDTEAPGNPTIDIIAGDDVINAEERDAGTPIAGVTFTGTADSATNLALCFNGSDSVTACTGGTAFTFSTGATSTTWDYILRSEQLITLDESSAHVLRVAATDPAGNPAPSIARRTFAADYTPPAAPTFDAVSTDNLINAMEAAAGLTLTGGNEAGATVALCLPGGTGTACPGGTLRATTVVSATTWSYPLLPADITAMGEGAETLTAIATDAAGNPSTDGTRDITVDTTAPMFTSGDTGAVAVNSLITVTAYTAAATDNAAVTYTLSGTNFDLFDIDSASGVVTYSTVQTTVATHNITITATDAAGNAATQDVTISVIGVPSAPTGVTLVPGNNQLTVSWTTVPEADNGGAAITGYTATAMATGQTTQTCTATGAATGCVITSLTNGTEYSVTVVATNSVGDSPAAPNPAATATPMAPAQGTTAPTAAPTSVMLVAGDAQLSVSWTAVSDTDNGGAPITAYIATATDTTDNSLTFACTAIGSATATACSDPITGLTNGVEYSVAVVATNSVGDGPASTPPVTATPAAVPAAPTNVMLVAGNAQISVSWTAVPDADNGGATITGYTATATDTTDTSRTFTCTATGATVTACANPITGLTNGVAYSVTVVATNSTGDSLRSSAATATPVTVPAAPTGVTLVAGDTELTVSWTAVPVTDNGGAVITGYTATATATGQTTGTCTATGAAATGCAITSLTNGTEYSVTVVATNSVGNSPAAPNPAATATPMAPTAPTAAPTNVMLVAGNAQLTVSWEAVSIADNGGAPITTYTATATEAVSPTNTFTCTATGAAATGCTITGLTNGTEYSVTVVATNSVDDSPPSTAAMATPIASAPVATVPAAPTNVMLVAGNAQLTVSWTAVPDADNGGADITGYTATATETTGAANTFTCTATGAAVTACANPISGLTNGVEYSVAVVATNSVGNSPASTAVTATPAAVPAAPTNVMLVAGNTQLTVSWTAVPDADNGGAAITGYTATATETTGAANTFTCTATGAVATTCGITGLTNGVDYSVAVVATNSEGNSAPSTAVLATPAAVPAAPTNVMLTPGNAQISISWTPVPAANNGGAAITGYTATATETVGAANTFTCTATGADATTCTITGLTNDTEYSVTVVATNDNGNSPPSTAETATPIATPIEVIEERITRQTEQILPRASQVATAATVASIATRIDAAATIAIPTPTYQLNGSSSLPQLLKHVDTMRQSDMEAEQLLDGSSFVLPLSAHAHDADGNKGVAAALSVWGGIDYRNLEGDEEGLEWDGGVSSVHFGIDGMVSEEVLAGVALSWNRADFAYQDTAADGTTNSGDYQYHSASINPYFGWLPSEDVKLWASAGFGSGEVVVEEQEADSKEYFTDSAQESLAGGFDLRLVRTNALSSGTATLRIKGDASMSKVKLDRAEGFLRQEVDSNRSRLLLSGEQQRKLASGAAMTPTLELGGRVDGGDGVTGTGMEVGGGLHYTNRGGNLIVSGNVRTLLAHEYDEWGADLSVRLLPPSGRGLSLSVNPVWGKTQSAAERLWDDGADDLAGELGGDDTALQGRVDSEVGYGIERTMLGKTGLLTPYAGMSMEGDGVERLRLGGRFVGGGDGMSLDLEGARENAADGVSHSLLLRGKLAF